MDSRATQSHAHEHHNIGSQQHVAHGAEEHHDDHEKKSVLKKMKAKAKKIKDTITKHGHHDHDQEHGHGYHHEDQNIPDDHGLDEEDDEDVQDPEIHGAPIYDSAAVRNVTPGKVKTSRVGVNFGGATVMGEPRDQEPRKAVVSPASDINQSRFNDLARTFIKEEYRAVQPRVNLERPMELEEDPHAPGSRVGPYSSSNYETKVTDPTKAGGEEIDITPVERSLERMAVQNEAKPIQEPKILSTIAENQYSCLGSHHQFTPELSTATKTSYPSTMIHDKNLPERSSEIKNQFPRSHGQLTPDLSTSTQTQYPSSGSHNQFIPELPTEHKHQYPSARTHDQNLPLYSTAINPLAGNHGHDQFMTEHKPQHTSAISHGQYLPQHSTPMNTQYPSGVSHDLTPQFPISTSHDQNLPQHSSALKTQYPSSTGSHDQFSSELRTGNVPQHSFPASHSQNLPLSFPASHDQNLPQYSSATRTQYSSAGNHDQLTPDSPTEHRPQHSFPASYDHTLPQYSSATQTQYPSVGSHDHFTPELQREAKSQHSIDRSHNQNLPQHSRTQYPSGESHDQFTPQFSDNRGNKNTTTAEEQQQSNQGNSYTDTIYLATAALADKAVTAKNAVASKLGYGENENETRSGENTSNQGNSYTEKMSSAASSIADKAAAAKDTVSSKVGYGGNENVNETRAGENQPNQSNQSGSYTDTIYLATAAIADKAVSAKNAVASKLGYGENENENVNVTRTGENSQNQSSSYTDKISSAMPSIADKATTAKNAVASKLGYGENENMNQSSIADKAASAKNTVASKLGFGEKDERNLENSSATSAYPATSATSDTSAKETPEEYGKRIAVSLTEELAPVYGKARGVGSAVKSKAETESGILEQDKGVSVKDYLSEKLKPGEDDVALSEMISENLYKDGNENDEKVYEEGKGANVNVSRPRGKVTESEEVKRRLGGWDDERKEESEKTVSDKVKDVVGSWFGSSGENQNQGSRVVSGNSDVGVEHVNEGVGGRRLHESTN